MIKFDYNIIVNITYTILYNIMEPNIKNLLYLH